MSPSRSTCLVGIEGVCEKAPGFERSDFVMRFPGAFGAQVTTTALLAIVLAAPAHGADAADDFRILYSEPLTLLAGNTSSAQLKANEVAPQNLNFDAYGRRFEISLERNAKLMQDATGTAVAYEGALAGQAGSWVRLTQTG